MSTPQNKVLIYWCADFAYALGLIVTDGCLSPDGRHITFVSKDLDLIETFQKCLGINLNVGRSKSGFANRKECFRVQIGDVLYYRFLESIGLMPKKSKVMSGIEMPDIYFADFLRGHLDGDGTFYSYFDPRWKSSFMYYTVFNSASPHHIAWLQEKIQTFWGIKGHISKSKNNSCIQLKYAKAESNILIEKIYHHPGLPCLERKRLKIFQALSIMPAR